MSSASLLRSLPPENTVNVSQPVTNTVSVITLGPQGASGPQGPSGSTFPYTGSAAITGSLVVTGSVRATSFTGSLLGTALFASTASYINTLNQNVRITGSVYINVGNDGTFQVVRGNKTITINTDGNLELINNSTGKVTIIASDEIIMNS